MISNSECRTRSLLHFAHLLPRADKTSRALLRGRSESGFWRLADPELPCSLQKRARWQSRSNHHLEGPRVTRIPRGRCGGNRPSLQSDARPGRYSTWSLWVTSFEDPVAVPTLRCSRYRSRESLCVQPGPPHLPDTEGRVIAGAAADEGSSRLPNRQSLAGPGAAGLLHRTPQYRPIRAGPRLLPVSVDDHQAWDRTRAMPATWRR